MSGTTRRTDTGWIVTTEAGDQTYYANSDELVSTWHSWAAVADGHLTVTLMEGHCTDMTGAIVVGRRLMPEVHTITTISGKTPDTEYHREGEVWSARMPGSAWSEGFVVDEAMEGRVVCRRPKGGA